MEKFHVRNKFTMTSNLVDGLNFTDK
jgi:hypothetical protein